MCFGRHGNYTVNICRNLTISSLNGPYNKRRIDAYFKYVGYLYSQNNFRPSNNLIRLQGEALFTPEAEVHFQLQLSKMLDYGLSRVIVVLQEAQYHPLIKYQWKKIFICTPIKLVFCTTFNEAGSILSYIEPNFTTSIQIPNFNTLIKLYETN